MQFQLVDFAWAWPWVTNFQPNWLAKKIHSMALSCHTQNPWAHGCHWTFFQYTPSAQLINVTDQLRQAAHDHILAGQNNSKNFLAPKGHRWVASRSPAGGPQALLRLLLSTSHKTQISWEGNHIEPDRYEPNTKCLEATHASPKSHERSKYGHTKFTRTIKRTTKEEAKALFKIGCYLLPSGSVLTGKRTP